MVKTKTAGSAVVEAMNWEARNGVGVCAYTYYVRLRYVRYGLEKSQVRGLIEAGASAEGDRGDERVRVKRNRKEE